LEQSLETKFQKLEIELNRREIGQSKLRELEKMQKEQEERLEQFESLVAELNYQREDPQEDIKLDLNKLRGRMRELEERSTDLEVQMKQGLKEQGEATEEKVGQAKVEMGERVEEMVEELARKAVEE